MISRLRWKPQLNSGIAEQLGCVVEQGRFGPVIAIDDAKMTNVAGVYAAGDIARANNALIAAAISLHASLVFAPPRHSALS